MRTVTYLKWGLVTLMALVVLGFLHYTLPQTDIVRITKTETKRMELGENSWFWASPDVGSAVTTGRDVFFINTEYPNGKIMIFRNEDTGWGWPPYFKVTSFNLQAEADKLISPKDAPQWVAVRHYGWRNAYFTIFPNAIKVWPVAGPDARVIPWFNILFFTLLAMAFVFFRRVWLQFRERTIDPVVQDAGDILDSIDTRADAARGRFTGWLNTWRKPKV